MVPHNNESDDSQADFWHSIVALKRMTFDPTLLPELIMVHRKLLVQVVLYFTVLRVLMTAESLLTVIGVLGL